MHLFKTRMLTLFRNKIVIFWSLIFPIVLSTFYSLAFSNLNTTTIFDTISIAVVDSEEMNQVLLGFLEEAKFDEEKNMFKVNLKSEEEAKDLLEDNKVVGVISTNQDSVTLMVNNSGLNQTIVKTFLDEYLQTTTAVMDIVVLSGSNPEDIINELYSNTSYIDDGSNEYSGINMLLIMYFSVIGMALIYGGFWGTDNILNLQANMSTKGIRVAVSPVNRIKIILIFTACAFLIHFGIISIVLLYMRFILGVEFGDKTLYILLVCVLGSLTGITFGSFVAISLKKASEGVKIMTTVLVGVVGGFLSGMMVVDMKYIIQTKAPILQYINPVGVITDSLHSLNYFGATSRFFTNIGILCVMIIAFTIGTYLFYRRDSYESI